MKINSTAFSHLNSLLVPHGFSDPILEKRNGENTFVVEPIAGKIEKAIRIREFVPVHFPNFSFPGDGTVNINKGTIIRKGRAILDFTLHLKR